MSQLQYIKWMLSEGGGAMSQEEVAGAEAPKDADAGQAAVAGCLDVNVAVADIDGIPTLQLSQGLENGIGGRLLTDACCFVFANSHWDVGEEMMDEFLGGCHHLIADDSHLAPTCLQLMDEFRDAVVWPCGVERVLHIILAEGGKGGFKLGITGSIGHGTFHQQAHTIAYETADVVDAVFRHTMLP